MRNACKFIFCVLSCIVVVSVFTINASAESTVRMPISSASLEELIRAETVEEVDALLYPHMKELPTRYFDLSCLAYYTGTLDIDTRVYDFLYERYQDEIYTYAEYRSASIYLSLQDLVERSDISEDVRQACLSVLYSDGLEYNVSLANIEKLRGILVEYRDVLSLMSVSLGEGAYENMPQYSSLLSTDVGGAYLLSPYDFDWETLSLLSEDVLDISLAVKLMKTQDTRCELFGLSKATGSIVAPAETMEENEPVATPSVQGSMNEWHSHLTPAEIARHSSISRREDITVPDVKRDNKPSINKIESDESESNGVSVDLPSKAAKSVEDFIGVSNEGVVETKRIGTHDVLLVVCGLFILVIAIVMGYLDYRDRKRDPVEYYNRKGW